MTKTTLTFEDLKSYGWKEVVEMQERKFRAFIRYQVYPNHPYYRRLFKEHEVDPWSIKKIEDWGKYQLPLTKKVEYRENIRDFVLNPKLADEGEKEPAQIIKNQLAYYKEIGHKEFRKKLLRKALKYKFGIGKSEAEKWIEHHLKWFFLPVQFWFSSGRGTGIPTPVFLSKYDWELMRKTAPKIGVLAYEDLIKQGIPPRPMNLFPYAPHLGFWGVNEGLYEFADFVYRTAAGASLTTENLIKIAETFKANGFAGMPNYIRNRFCRELVRLNVKLPEKKGIVLSAGEKAYRRVKKDIKEAFAHAGMEVKIVEGYSASEVKIGFAAECAENGGLHNISPLLVAYRTVKFTDGEWEFTSPEEGGHIVIFHLDGTGTVFEGYLMGDYVEKIEIDKCGECGIEGPRLYGISRSSEIETQLKIMGIAETKIKGSTVNLTALRETLLQLPEIFECQIVITKENPNDPYSMDVLKIYAALASDVTVDTAEIIRKITHVTKTETEVTPKVEILGLEELIERAGGMKFREIVDLRPNVQSEK